MIEAYAFLAVFTVQIVAMSVVYPVWLTRNVRAHAASIPTERLARLYPGVDFDRARERFLALYRAVSAGITVLGILLLAWLFNDAQRPDWYRGPAKDLAVGYLLLQISPLLLLALIGLTSNKSLKRALQEKKRTAILRRRGLFDFVSPCTALLAVVSYLLFVAFAVYVQQHPFPGFAGLGKKAGGITLVYALNALLAYQMLYGRKKNPLETHEGHVHTIASTVKISIYSCIACSIFLSLDLALGVMGLPRWEPFALGVFLVTTALLVLAGLRAPPRDREGDGPGSGPAH